MKFTTIYLGENKIEIFNSILGKETIKVNGATISTKYSALGTEHHFKLMENEVESDCKIITGMGLNGVVIDFYKDEMPIIESPKSGCFAFILIVIFVAFLIGGLMSIFN